MAPRRDPHPDQQTFEGERPMIRRILPAFMVILMTAAGAPAWAGGLW